MLMKDQRATKHKWMQLPKLAHQSNRHESTTNARQLLLPLAWARSEIRNIRRYAVPNTKEIEQHRTILWIYAPQWRTFQNSKSENIVKAWRTSIVMPKAGWNHLHLWRMKDKRYWTQRFKRIPSQCGNFIDTPLKQYLFLWDKTVCRRVGINIIGSTMTNSIP